MIKFLLFFGAVGLAAYFILGKRTIGGTVFADYSGAKITSPSVSPGDSPQNALIGPSQYNY